MKQSIARDTGLGILNSIKLIEFLSLRGVLEHPEHPPWIRHCRTYRTEEDPREIPDLFVSLIKVESTMYVIIIGKHNTHQHAHKQIDNDDFRVFVLNSYPNARIICEVYAHKFTCHTAINYMHVF